MDMQDFEVDVSEESAGNSVDASVSEDAGTSVFSDCVVTACC